MKYTTQWNETIGAYEVVRRSDDTVVQTNIMTGGKAEVARHIWEGREADQYFTLVFKGNLRDFKDPFKTETPFGVPFAAGVGDAFAELGDAFAENNNLRELLERLPPSPCK